MVLMRHIQEVQGFFGIELSLFDALGRWQKNTRFTSFCAENQGSQVMPREPKQEAPVLGLFVRCLIQASEQIAAEFEL